MTNVETELEMVQRHVRQGKALVTRQHELVAELQAGSYSTEVAESILRSFQTIQIEHEAHLKRLMRLKPAGVPD